MRLVRAARVNFCYYRGIDHRVYYSKDMEYTLVAFSLVERVAFTRKFNLGFTTDSWQQKLEDQGFCCFLFHGDRFVNGSSLSEDIETGKNNWAKSSLTANQWQEGAKNGSNGDPFLENKNLAY